MSYFFYNGYYSYEMGLIVEEKSIYNGPQPDFELVSVPGRGGDDQLQGRSAVSNQLAR